MSWCTWKDRCNHFMEGHHSDPDVIVFKSWTRLGIYIRHHWAKHMARIRGGKLSLVEARILMSHDYGTSKEVWDLHYEKLQIPPVPPRPP